MIIHADVWAEGPITVQWHRSGHSAADVARGLPSHTVGIAAADGRGGNTAARISFTRPEAEALVGALAAALAEIDTDTVTDDRMAEADRLITAEFADRARKSALTRG